MASTVTGDGAAEAIEAARNALARAKALQAQEEQERPMPSPVGTLFASLQAAQNSQRDSHRDFFRAGRTSSPGADGYSSSSSQGHERDFLKKPDRLTRAAHVPTEAAAGKVYPASLKKLSSEGLLLDMHQLMRDASATLDVFKGSLVVLMLTSNVIITMSSTHLRSHSYGSLVICNAAASTCFVGLLLAFGFSCYTQYLCEWPDPRKELGSLRLRVSRAIAFPVVGAWACNFVWCFICLKNDLTAANLFDVFTFSRVFGNGPDFLCSFSLDLALVYALWRPIMQLLEHAGRAELGANFGFIAKLSLEQRQDLAAVAIALSPLLFTLVAVPDCTGPHRRWVQWFLVCDKRDIDTSSLPALPYLMDFGLGILVAACWKRFLADLRPVGDGGPNGGHSILPMQALRHWCIITLSTSMALLLLFLPLGQVWFYTDLSVVKMSTPFGHLIRGFSDGPSMLWLLSTLWPAATLAGIVVVLVTLRGTPLGVVLQWPLGWLEHMGANILYYLIVTDLFLAGMFRGFAHSDPFPFTLPACLLCTAFILSIGRFLHFMCRSARK